MSPGKRLFIPVVAVFLLLTPRTQAQNLTGSPYSRFGIGDLNAATFARNLGMGGIESSLHSGANINPGNPASYSSLLFTTYEGGLSFNQYELSTASRKQATNTLSLSYFSFAFPVSAQKMGLGFGLQPYSDVGYNIEENFTSPTGGAEVHRYSGSGGLNQFYFAAGYAPLKKLSIGVKADYIFGTINHSRNVEFSESVYLNSRIQNTSTIGWFNFNFGLQFRADSLPVSPSDSIIMLNRQIEELEDSVKRIISVAGKAQNDNYEEINSIRSAIAQAKEIRKNVADRKKRSDWHFTAGVIVSPTAELRGTGNLLVENYKTNSQNAVIIRDTIVNIEESDGIVTLPLRATAGFAFRNGTRWNFGADVSVQQWSDFNFFGRNDSLTDAWRVSAGAQFTPNDRSVNSYLQQVQYRLGAYYASTFLNLRSNQLTDMGITAGIGFPVRRAGTVIHLSASAGQRGTTDNNLILEKYIRLTLGFTINDRWFFKPKYD